MLPSLSDKRRCPLSNETSKHLKYSRGHQDPGVTSITTSSLTDDEAVAASEEVPPTTFASAAGAGIGSLSPVGDKTVLVKEEDGQIVKRVWHPSFWMMTADDTKKNEAGDTAIFFPLETTPAEGSATTTSRQMDEQEFFMSRLKLITLVSAGSATGGLILIVVFSLWRFGRR